MAKCIQSIKSGNVKRVSNDQAIKEVDSGKFKYISKSDYKRVLNGFVKTNNNQSKGA